MARTNAQPGRERRSTLPACGGDRRGVQRARQGASGQVAEQGVAEPTGSRRIPKPSCRSKEKTFFSPSLDLHTKDLLQAVNREGSTTGVPLPLDFDMCDTEQL
jgi:hypothetical protein